MTPPAVTFRNRPRALLALGLFWAGESLLGFGLGAVLLAEARTMPAWILALGVLMALFLAIVGLHLSVLCLRQLGSPDPVLALGPEGYFDRRLCPHPIAWHLVSRVVVYHARGVQVAFELAPAADAGVRRLPRLLARLNRSVGLPGYSLSLMATDAQDIDIARAMHGWHAVAHPQPPALGADPA
jgi:hypothetical protein